jgi:hypothetical protein
MILRFNALSNWVTWEVLRVEKLKERAAVVQRLIDVGKAGKKITFQKYNNFIYSIRNRKN